MGGKHSQLVGDYLAHEAFGDGTAKAIKRGFEKSIRGSEDKVLQELQSGDATDPGRNENLILGALPHDIKAYAYFHIYSKFLSTSRLLNAICVAGSKGSKGVVALSRRSSWAEEADEMTEFQASVVTQINRNVAGLHQQIVVSKSRPAVFMIRRGTVIVRGNKSMHGDSRAVTAGPGCIIDVGLSHDKEVVVMQPNDNEPTILERDTVVATAETAGLVFGELPGSVLETLVEHVPAALDAWNSTRSTATHRRKQIAAQQEKLRVQALNMRLITAASEGDAEAVVAALGDGASTTFTAGSLQRTALLSAVFEQHLGAVQALVAAGADVGASDVNGDTALHYAAKDGWMAGFEALVEVEPAYMCLKSKTQDTPVHVAAAAGQVDMLKAMLECAKARDVTLPLQHCNAQGQTPVAAATTLGARRVLKPRTDRGGASHVR